VIAGVLSAGFASSASAQDQAENSWNLKGLTRLNTKLGTGGSCKQILPNLVVKASNKNWELSGALKIDNLEAADGCFGKHDTRLFFGKAQYKGWQDHGTTVTAGLLAPFELAKYPLINGYTPVVLDNAQQLYGGITGLRVDQIVASNAQTSLSLNGVIGTKPDSVERFGPSIEVVTSAGFMLKHKFNENLSAEFGGRVIDFEDDINPSGKDFFGYSTLTYTTPKADYELYAEMTEGQRVNAQMSQSTDRHTLLGRARFKLDPQKQWHVAAGSVDGEWAAETSFYQKFENGLSATVGLGHTNNDNTLQIGLIKSF
ncbi:MAG: hypothetical protein AAF204_02765, partial [Pseudomonadota bacterium]